MRWGPISGHCIRGIWKMSSDYVHFALVESCRFMVRKLPAAKLICHNLPTTAWSSYLISPYQGTWKALCFHHGLATHTLSQRLVHVLFSGFVLHHFHPSLLDIFGYYLLYHIYGYVYIYIYVSIPKSWVMFSNQAVYQALFSVASRRKGSFAEHWKELKHSLEQPIRAPFSQ